MWVLIRIKSTGISTQETRTHFEIILLLMTQPYKHTRTRTAPLHIHITFISVRQTAVRGSRHINFFAHTARVYEHECGGKRTWTAQTTRSLLSRTDHGRPPFTFSMLMVALDAHTLAASGEMRGWMGWTGDGTKNVASIVVQRCAQTFSAPMLSTFASVIYHHHCNLNSCVCVWSPSRPLGAHNALARCERTWHMDVVVAGRRERGSRM